VRVHQLQHALNAAGIRLPCKRVLQVADEACKQAGPQLVWRTNQLMDFSAAQNTQRNKHVSKAK
jgi:hypothetical protein